MRSTYIYPCKYDGGRTVRCVPIPSEGHGAPVGSHCPIAHHTRTHTCTILPSSSFLPASSSLKAASTSFALLGGWDPVSAH